MARIRSSSSATRMSGCVLIGSRGFRVLGAGCWVKAATQHPAPNTRNPLSLPFPREHRVGDEVFEVVVHPLGLAVRALLREAEALGDAAAADVLDGAVDFDAVGG